MLIIETILTLMKDMMLVINCSNEETHHVTR